MKIDDKPPILIPAKSIVLLVFMPPDRQQRAELTSVVNSLRNFLDGPLRILQLEEDTHPEVIRSFEITCLPAFILVRQGVELWRHEGQPDDTIRMALTQRLLAVSGP